MVEGEATHCGCFDIACGVSVKDEVRDTSLAASEISINDRCVVLATFLHVPTSYLILRTYGFLK